MRTFVDAEGTEWRVWKVTADPRFLLDRRRSDEGGQPLPAVEDEERGVGPDRRRGDLRGGWLCFDAGSERRRLFPVPAEWESYSDARLDLMRRMATVVPSRPTGPRGDSP